MTGAPKLSESDITGQIKDFLSHRGWRAIRHQRTVVPGAFQAGEPGMPDFLFLRYLERGYGLVLWVELKRPSDRRKCRCLQNAGTRKRCTVCDQANWRKREEGRGAKVWRVDDLEWFAEEYQREYGWLHRGATGRGQLELGA